MNLFQLGNFRLHSGAVSGWKIECDALTSADWDALAVMVWELVPFYGSVEGVPRGGLPLAERLHQWRTHDGPLLIVDDVLTSGGSMEEHRAGRDAVGAVVFARGACPPWVTPLFQMTTGVESRP